jgi:hypothetical protein
MTEPITRHQDSERRGPIMSPAGAPAAHSATGRVRSAAWFAGGRRRRYDPARRTLAPDSNTGLPHVFERVHGDPSPDGHWVSMLPGFPDGSYGWAQVDAQLRDPPGPRLYVEYLGQGNSDPGEIELRGRVGNPQELMIMTAAVPSLTAAARPGRGQQQRGRGRRPILGRL